jgi:conjugal transfer pilus assembly protein TraW
MSIKTLTSSKLISYFFMIIILFISSSVYARNVGTIGQIYSIKEIDFLEFIQSRALAMHENGLIKKLQSDMQNHAASYRDRPTPVSDIEHTTESKGWLFDPSIVLDHDVKAPDGKVIAAQGTRVNPLVHVSLSKILIFYDADDKKEIKWVLELDKKLEGKDKIILVKGSILQEEKRLAKQVYFDQSGRLTTKFNIKHVPATVEQEGVSLRISEVKP